MFELRSSVLIWIWTELAFTSHAKWSTVKLKITRVAPLILWKLDVTYIYINYSNLLWINSDIIRGVVVRCFFIFNYMIIKINIYKKIWKNNINKKKIYVKTTMIWKWIKKHIFLIESLIFLFIYLFFVLTMIFFKWKLIIIMETSLN